MLSFNGAATFQLRIAVDFLSPVPKILPILQWSRNFSVADCWLKRSNGKFDMTPSMEPQLFSCGLQKRKTRQPLRQSFSFNGAATFQLRIASGSGIVSRDFQPSMEPQLFSCGLLAITTHRQKVQKTAFNGAATFQLRIETENNPHLTRAPTFNGAATFQLRIDSKKCGGGGTLTGLQWSRNFSVADC